MARLSLVLLALLILAPAATAEPDVALPRPPELEPDVRFWTRVYTEVDGTAGLIHDSERLDVVYEVLRLPRGLSARAQERRVEKAKSRIREALRVLAKGRRTGLDAEQARVLGLWPEGTTNATLRGAARRLRFQLGQADKFRRGLVRQGAWKEYIEKTLAEHGVPRNLVALPHVESSYNEKAYSRVGAAGLWQFTRSTGRRYLRVDGVVDERLDPFKATAAAARLLRDNHRRIKSWPLAITAYNHGVGGMSRAVRKLGTRDISTIARRYRSRTFGFASRNFYCEFLAADEIDRNAERFFGPLERNRPVDFEIVEMPHFLQVSSLVRVLGVGRDLLRSHNLALREAVWQGSKYVPRGYELRVPKSALSEPPALALARIPADQRLARQHRDRLYTVQRGDSLSRIAGRYGVGVRELVELNNLRSRHRIHAGQVLTLPDDSRGGTVLAEVADPPADGIYTVRRGDNLSGIARRFGLRQAEIVQWNGLRSRHRISVGQRLRLAPEPAPVVLASAGPSPAAVRPGAPEPALAVAEATAEPEAAAEPEPEPEPEAASAVDLPEAEGPPQGPREVELEDVVSPETLDSFGTELAEQVPAPEAAPRPAAEEPPGEALPSTWELIVALATGDPEDGPEASPSPAEAPEEDPAEPAEAGPAAMEPAAAPDPRAPDPSDYAVHPNRSITVQADETLGHYAEWLEVRTSVLRRLNGLRSGSTVVIGRPAKLDFSRVAPEEFERRRLEYHQTLQRDFFGAFSVTGTQEHMLRRGETLWELAMQRYKLPMWLLRQYNPEVDFGALAPGTRMIVPTVEPRASAT